MFIKLFLRLPFLILTICLLLLSSASFAVDDLTAMEQAFFHRDYSFDLPENRLSRLETFMLGKPQEGLYNDRFAKLTLVATQNKVNLQSIPLDPDEDYEPNTASLPNNPTLPESPYTFSTDARSQNNVSISQLPDATEYPIVTEMERKLFHQAYDTEPINNRLARLEQSIFRQTAPPEVPLAQRVDKLASKIIPADPSVIQQQLEAQYASRSALRNFPQNSNQMAASDMAIYGLLNGIEIQVMGRPFGGEPLVQRLSRLETRIFGRIQAGTIDSRFDKIASNYQSALQRNWTPQPQVPGLPPNFRVSPPVTAQQFMPAMPQQQLPPMSTGNFLKDLAQLETRVFGQIFDKDPVSNRLTNLEIQMLNQTFIFMPPEQRLTQLMFRAAQAGPVSQVGSN